MENISILEIRWTVSRGQETDGYSICTLYANGQKVAVTKGGGYDMVGTVVGGYLMASFSDRIQKLFETTKVPGDRPDYIKSTHYGLFGAEGKRAWLDGGCGLDCMIDIAGVIGVEIGKRMLKSGDTVFLVSDLAHDHAAAELVPAVKTEKTKN
jgi:hypothetical protein